MYAAAGGASLASRQARQKQRQQKTKQLKAQKDLTPKPPQAKQFHNYTDTAAAPRLSRVERGTLKPPSQGERRHSTSNYHLKEPHAKSRIRESPSICIPVQPTSHHHHHHASTHHLPQLPLSPTTLVQQNHVAESTYSLQNQLPQIFVPEDGKLERRCSFVRQVEEVGKKEEDVLDRCNHICNFEIKDKTWESNTQYYLDEKEVFGSLDYPFSECSQGRTAWQERERGRRCSLSEEARQHRIKQTEAHHRWMKRNRIHDTTYGGGSDDDEEYVAFHQSAAANALLYVGLGTTAIGSVIFFVGTGEKGFKTLELRLIGPTLIVAGLLCCLIRVLLCACPTTCFRSRNKTRLKESACPHRDSRRRLAPRYPETADQVDFVPADKTALLHKGTRKKVSIVPPNYSLPSTSTSEFKELPSLNIESEVRKLSIPQIHLPSLPDSEEHSRVSHEDSMIELAPMDFIYDIQSVSSNDSEGLTVIEKKETEDSTSSTSKVMVAESSKLTRIREPACSKSDVVISSASGHKSDSDNVKTEIGYASETLSVVIERSDNSESSLNNASDGSEPSGEQLMVRGQEETRKEQKKTTSDTKHSGIVLSPLQLGQ
ncbi:uncharacterized protein LOC126738327 [Anthonomus grandis grandis]|uniref:uncharacterized protein LOC126738327 n=1 Tax=Anthonomus grandis grandis TaxID=2921223 RepID=UPI002165AA13|nr:uncharacterized protein LOC126738327 [Anthonomus grandis grandis]